MNALQLAPLSVKPTPPGPTGGSPPVGEASPTPGTAPKPQPGYAKQQQQLAEARANTARATAERKAQAQAAAQDDSGSAPADTLDRKVGLVDGTFKVFVDLVKPPGDQAVFRVFGPSENDPPPPAALPSSTAASSAYSRGAAGALPLKDLGIA